MPILLLLVKGQLVTLHAFFSPVCRAVLLLSVWDVEYFAGDDDEDDEDKDRMIIKCTYG